MTDQDQLIEIAKFDGWTHIKVPQKFNHLWAPGHVTTRDDGDWQHTDGYCCSFDCLPNYLTSRDAIVPVIEKHKEKRLHIIGCLSDMLWPKDFPFENLLTVEHSWMFLTATPRQLCEALLRATRKWKD